MKNISTDMSIENLPNVPDPFQAIHQLTSLPHTDTSPELGTEGCDSSANVDDPLLNTSHPQATPLKPHPRPHPPPPQDQGQYLLIVCTEENTRQSPIAYKPFGHYTSPPYHLTLPPSLPPSPSADESDGATISTPGVNKVSEEKSGSDRTLAAEKNGEVHTPTLSLSQSNTPITPEPRTDTSQTTHPRAATPLKPRPRPSPAPRHQGWHNNII